MKEETVKDCYNILHMFSMCTQVSVWIHILLVNFHTRRLFISAEHSNALEKIGHFIGLIGDVRSFHLDFRGR